MFSKTDALNMSFCGHNCLSFMPSRLIVHGPGVQISHGVNLSYFSALIVKQLQSYMQMIKKSTKSYTEEHALQYFVLPSYDFMQTVDAYVSLIPLGKQSIYEGMVQSPYVTPSVIGERWSYFATTRI